VVEQARQEYEALIPQRLSEDCSPRCPRRGLTPAVHPPDAPRRAGPEPGDAALVGRGRGRHHGSNHHTRYAWQPAAAKRRASAGRVSWGQPPSGYSGESPGADLALQHAHCHDALHTRDPKGRTVREAGDCLPDQN
jgi:hypothetical protein